MADNIFDAQRDRRIQHLQQQSVSNIVRSNPNLRGVLSRYEDAEVSRIKLLELQRLRNKKITKGERALLKAVAKGRRGGGGRVGRGGKKVKVLRRIPVADADGVVRNQTRVIEVEEFVGKDQQIGEGGSKDPIDPELERDKLRLEEQKEQTRQRQQDRFLELEDFRQQREFIANERTLEQRELQRQTDFATGQNRLIADAQIAQFNQAQETFRAGQRDQQRIQDRQLEEDRLELQRREIDNQFQTNREQRALEYRRIDNDRDRYNADVRRAEIERDQLIARQDAELQGIRERVAADNARQHAELQQTQQLALERLAAQQRDNELQHQREQNRIDNQRAVDAERAITDRELIQTLQSSIDALNRFQVPQDLPEGRGNVEETDTPPAEPARAPQTSSSDESLGGGGGLALVEATDSDLSSADTLAAAPPNIQRLASIQAGRDSPRSPRQQERRFERRGIDDPTAEGQPTPGALRESPQAPERFAQPADEEVVANRLRGQRRIAPPTQPEPELALSESSGSDIGSVPSEFERILRESPPAGLRTQEEQVGVGQRAAGAVVGGLQTAGAAVGGALGGVAQGIGEQLPSASDVGAAVGRGGVRLVGGIASAAYQGLRGSPRPGEQTGGRLDPAGQVVGLGREIESPERQP